MKTWPLVLAGLVLPRVAFAHDLWLEKSGEGLVVRYGHRGADLVPIEASKVKALRCARAGRTADVLAQAVFTAREMRVAARCEAISVFLYGGFYSLTPDGEKNLPKDEVANAVRAWESKEFAKWVDARAPAAAVSLGDELEIVANDLGRTAVGEKITVRVLWGGKAVSGAVVAYGERVVGETDSAGETRVRLRERGLQIVSATYRRPLHSAQADEQVLQATLCFEVGS